MKHSSPTCPSTHQLLVSCFLHVDMLPSLERGWRLVEPTSTENTMQEPRKRVAAWCQRLNKSSASKTNFHKINSHNDKFLFEALPVALGRTKLRESSTLLHGLFHWKASTRQSTSSTSMSQPFGFQENYTYLVRFSQLYKLIIMAAFEMLFWLHRLPSAACRAQTVWNVEKKQPFRVDIVR